MFRKLSLPAIVLVICSSIVQAQTSLEFKYPEGKKSTSQKEVRTTQTLTLAGMNIDTKSSTFVVGTSVIGTRAADGALKIEEKADSMQSEISFPGGSVQFDSANPDKKSDNPALEPILEIFRAAFRLPVTVELNAKNKITAVKLPDGEFEKLPEAAKDRFSPEALKKAIEQLHDFCPDGPVKKGDTWERASETNLGAGQIMSFRTKYEYEGTVDKDGVTLDKISGKAFDVSFAINGNPMIQLTSSDLKIIESKSTHLFDRERGSVISHTAKTQVAGPLTLVINGAELAGKVDLTVEENFSAQK